MHRIAILFYGRVGSTLLIEILNTHPDILMFEELMNPNGIAWGISDDKVQEITKSIDIAGDILKERESNPCSIVNSILTAAEKAFNKKYFGFKHAIHQSKDVTNWLLREERVKKIILRRENMLAVYSSFLLARRTKIFHITNNKNDAHGGKEFYDKYINMDKPSLEFIEEDFLKFKEEVDTIYNDVIIELDRLNQDYLLLEYVDIFSNNALERISKFIEVENVFNTAETKLKKLNTNNPLDRFNNPEEVLRYLDRNDCLSWGTNEIINSSLT